MKNFLIHLLIWIAFFFVWLQVSYFYVDDLKTQMGFALFDCAAIIATFYAVYFLLAPRLFSKKNKIVSVIFLILSVAILSWVMTEAMKLGVSQGLIKLNLIFQWNYNELVFNRYFIVSLAVAIGALAYTSMNWLRQRSRMEKLEGENKQAELSLLKAQLNPHFLFNSLNGIYVQMDLEDSPAKKSLHTFSHLLRYQLYECNADKVQLSKEVEYLRSFIELQKTRKNSSVRIGFHADSIADHWMIAPMLLIVFVENAFKYVSDTGSGDYIDSTLNIQGSTLIFSVKNSKVNIAYPQQEDKIGLKNVKRRLELLYPETHQLRINNNETNFEVYLSIEL